MFVNTVPYSGYENYDFEVPLEYEGDAYARVLVHFREIEEESSKS